MTKFTKLSINETTIEDEITEYKEGDVIVTPPNSKHKIEAEGEETSEYFFIRVKTK